jgi:predicted RND superfamily exporter protein
LNIGYWSFRTKDFRDAMPNLWLTLFELSRERKWLLPVVFAAIAGLSALGASRLHFTEDVFELLPQDDPSVNEGRLALSRFRTLERIVIDVEGPDSARVVAGIDQLAVELEKTPGISKVTYRVSDEALADIAQLYDGRTPLLFDESLGAEVEARIATGEFDRRLQDFVDNAEGKSGIQATTAQFRRDPYAFQELLFRRFAQLNSGFEVQLVGGHLVSKDGKHGLIVAEASIPASNTREGRVLMHEIDARMAKLPTGVNARVIGGHRSAADNADVIESDIKLTVATSVLGVLIIFLLAFRGIMPIFATLGAVGMGFGVALGVQGATTGSLSAITAGFGAALLGISVDYTIHLAAAVSGAQGDTPSGKMREALRHVSKPNFLAMLTTVLAICTLWFSRFAGLSQLAEIAAVGVACAFVFAMILGPVVLLPFARGVAKTNPLEWAVDRAARARFRAPLPLMIACALLTPALGFGLIWLSIDGDVTHLDGKSAKTREAEDLVAKTYGGATLRRTLIVSGGENLEAALAENDNVARSLSAVGAPKYESIAWVLPAQITQRDNIARWRNFWSGERIAQLKLRMAAVKAVRHTEGGAKEVTFTQERLESYFAEFFASLTPPEKVETLDASSLRARPLWDLVRNYVSESNGRVNIATLAMLSHEAEADPGSQAAIALESRRIGELKAMAPSGLVLNRVVFASHIVGLVKADLLLLGGLSLLLVICVLWLSFRDYGDVLVALIPVGGGLIWTLGAMGWMGVSFNIINTLVTVFIAGLGIDYGIFVVQTYREATDAQDVHRRLVKAATGISAAALTTLFGFGSLALASHPALFSVGITTTIGVLSALVLAVFVVPSIMDWRMGRQKVHG